MNDQGFRHSAPFDRRTFLAFLGSGLVSPVFAQRGGLTQAQRRSMHRRKLIGEFPHTPSIVQDALGKSVYPQGLAVDSQQGHLYTFHGFSSRDTFRGTLVCVHRIADRSLVTWFLTTERCRESFVLRRTEDGLRIYTPGTRRPVYYNLTRLPAPGTLIEPAHVFAQAAQSYYTMAHTRRGFCYMSGDPALSGGRGEKTYYITTDENFNTTGSLEFPRYVVGTYAEADLMNYPKTQGVTFALNHYIFGAGKDYQRGASGRMGAAQLPGNYQGLLACDESGRFVEAALCDPNFFLNTAGRMSGRPLSFVENEGLSVAADGRIYAIWQVEARSQWATAGRSRGIMLTEEMSSSEGSYDFYEGRVPYEELVSDPKLKK